MGLLNTADTTCDPSLFLFFLFLWDVIYLPIPYAFANPYSTVPIDFSSRLFWNARQSAIRELLNNIETLSDEDVEGIAFNRTTDFLAFVTASIRKHQGIQCPIHWNLVDEGIV